MLKCDSSDFVKDLVIELFLVKKYMINIFSTRMVSLVKVKSTNVPYYK